MEHREHGVVRVDIGEAAGWPGHLGGGGLRAGPGLVVRQWRLTRIFKRHAKVHAQGGPPVQRVCTR